MNERIRELAEQAWVYQVRVLNELDGSRTYTEKEKVFDKEKFAELIVRECIEVIDMTHGSKKLMRPDPYQKIIWAIEEHFGVES